MANQLHIRRNDMVVVRKGVAASGGKAGKVLQVLPKKRRAIVEGMNYIYKHLRKSQENPNGKIIQKEAPIAAANLMLYCPQCKKGTRPRRVADEAGNKTRKCRKCDYPFDR